jgi:hypothetical protein
MAVEDKDTREAGAALQSLADAACRNCDRETAGGKRCEPTNKNVEC